MRNYTKEEMEERVLDLLRFFQREGYTEEEAIELMEILIDILMTKLEEEEDDLPGF